jgi:cytochrome c553
MGRAGKRAAVVAALIAGTPLAFAEPPEKLVPCLTCHGADGQSQIEKVPSLGAQPAPYSVIQLFLFRERMRVAEPMNDLAKELSNRSRKRLVHHPAPIRPARIVVR